MGSGITEIKTIDAGKNMKPQGVVPSVLLLNPKYPRNVSMAIRLCSCYGFSQLWYTGSRVSLTDPSKNVSESGGKRRKSKKPRLPREERMKGYANVDVIQSEKPFDQFPGAVPVAIELCDGATQLQDFEHPDNAVYVFGPEDGGIDKISMGFCHHRVVIPTHHCLNLSTAMSTILWDRKLKRMMEGKEEAQPMEVLLKNDRAFLRNDEELVY